MMHEHNPPQPVIDVDHFPFKMGSRVRRGLYLEDAASVHAVIERRGANHELIDLRSGGTQVNGSSIERAMLRNGDLIDIGTHRLEVIIDDKHLSLLWCDSPIEPDHPLEELHIATPPLPDQGTWEHFASWFQAEAAAESPKPIAPSLDVALVWGVQIVWTKTIQPHQTITIGQNGRADLTVEHQLLSESPTTLLSHHEGLGWVVVLPEDVPGIYQGQDHHQTLEHHQQCHGNELILDTQSGEQRVELYFGAVEVHIHMSECAPRLHRPLSLDPTPFPYVGASACLHWLALMMLLSLPSVPPIEFDIEQIDDHFVTLAPPPTVTPKTKHKPGRDLMGDGQDKTISAHHGGPEGRAGQKHAKSKRARLKMRKPKANSGAQNNAKALAQQRAHKNGKTASARTASNISTVGALGALEKQKGKGGMMLGQSSIEALGQLKHAKVGASKGNFGLGISQTGRGGAGRDEKGVGIALKSKNTGSKLGGSGMSFLKKRRSPRAPQDLLLQTKPFKSNCLTPQIIRRVIRSRQRQLRVCYEAALVRHPSLKGKLTPKLTIDAAQGKVVGVKIINDSLQSAIVRRCVVKQLKTLQFPQAPGCHKIYAKYPLNFQAPKHTARGHHQDGQEGPGVFK